MSAVIPIPPLSELRAFSYEDLTQELELQVIEIAKAELAQQRRRTPYFDAMVRIFDEKIRAELYKYVSRQFPITDLLSGAYRGFKRAIELFDPKKGKRFWSYADLWVIKAPRGEIQSITKPRIPTISLDYACDDGKTPEFGTGDDLLKKLHEQYTEIQAKEGFTAALKDLPVNEQHTLRGRLIEERTCADIGKEVDQHGSTISRRYNKAIEKVRSSVAEFLEQQPIFTIEEAPKPLTEKGIQRIKRWIEQFTGKPPTLLEKVLNEKRPPEEPRFEPTASIWDLFSVIAATEDTSEDTPEPNTEGLLGYIIGTFNGIVHRAFSEIATSLNETREPIKGADQQILATDANDGDRTANHQGSRVTIFKRLWPTRAHPHDPKNQETPMNKYLWRYGPLMLIAWWFTQAPAMAQTTAGTSCPPGLFASFGIITRLVNILHMPIQAPHTCAMADLAMLVTGLAGMGAFIAGAIRGYI